MTRSPFSLVRLGRASCVVGIVLALLLGSSLLRVAASDVRIQGYEITVEAKQFRLANGLTVVVHEDRSAPLVSVHVWYHVGSKNEPTGKAGFAHLFEHLMFNGSEHFNDDFFKATQRIGATGVNGTTNVDRTNYFQTVPKAALDTILWLESDRMGHLLGAVDQAKLDEQRSVVKNEKREGDNKPYAKAWDLIIRATVPVGHPYAHSVIGSMEDLDAASLEDVRDWFRTYYGPSNAVLVLSGDITLDEAKAKVEHYFGAIAPGTPVSQPTNWVVKRTGTVREIAYDRVAQPRLYRVWNVSNYASPDTGYLQLLGQLLAGDKNARLHKRLVIDESLATGVSAEVWNREIGGQFVITATVKPGGDIARVEAIVEEELKGLLDAGPTNAELARVRTAAIGSFIRSMESISGKAGLLAESQTYLGDPDGWKASFERYKTATSEQVMAAGRAWLTDGDYVLHILPFGNLTAGTEDADRSVMPMPESIVSAEFPATERATLDNGMELVVARRSGVPMVNMTLLLHTGVPTDFEAISPGTGSLAMNLLDEGTTTRTTEQLVDALANLGATLSSGGGGETSHVSLSALRPSLPEAIAIYADVILNPAFTHVDLQRLKRQALAAIASNKQDPARSARRIASTLLFGPDHPYGRLVTEADVQTIEVEDVVAFYRRWFHPNNATLIVTGETDLAEIRSLVETAFANWKPGTVAETFVPEAKGADTSIVYLIDKPGAPQTEIIALLAAPPRKEGDAIAREALNIVLGGSFTSRLNMKLREEMGWTYGASSSIGGGRGPQRFSASAAVQTDKSVESMAEIAKAIAEIGSARPVDVNELTAARDEMSLGLTSAWATSAGIGRYLMTQQTYGLPNDYYVNYPGNVADVTLDAVHAEAKSMLNDRPLTWVIVGDLATIESGIRELDFGEVRVIDADGKSIQ